MTPMVAMGGTCMCTFGTTPGNLTSTSNFTVLVGGRPALTMTDAAPMVNITPFGMCTTPSNPQVAAATAAALGVLTPQPCMPVIAGTWTPGAPTVLVGGKPCLTLGSKCMCSWGGVVSIVNPGQLTVIAG